MSGTKKIEEFPEVEAKLQKPSRQSAFEKEKADREAKKRREAAETAAVYESFVKSFDHDDDDEDEIDAIARGGGGAPFGSSSRGASVRGALFGGGAGRRHFGGGAGGASGTGLKSGPGSLGPPPTSYGRKRGLDGGFQRDFGRRGLDEGRGRLGFEDERDRELDAPPSKTKLKAFDTSDDEGDSRAVERAEERAVARPTLRLANLPPGTSPAVIKALIPSNLTVENVKILPPRGPGSSERNSRTSIVVLSQETPATDIDAAVSALQNRYLGYGFYLSLHRHLSSAVTSAVTATSLSSTTTSHPFGAKPVAQKKEHQPPQFHRGFAPPTSYGPPGGPISRTILHVPIQAPGDIKQLQLIHKVVESVLEHGPEFEALLMSRPDVQREEKWAWLWDARSEGGIWYRWRLWEVITGAQAKVNKQGKFLPLFEGSHAWKVPEKPLIYEYATRIDEFVSDPEYNSSDEEDYEDEGNKQEGGPGVDNENTYLNPFDKAKLAHLLARLPTTLSRIRKGDVARVTTFAITHASRGADEIVDMIVMNVEKPFALTSANPEYKQNAKRDNEQPPNGNSSTSTPIPDDPASKANNSEPADSSASSLVGLYIVSDILSSSATSGVRHSWRYRQLFETALRECKTFEHLGQIAERLSWGRLRAEKWKRSVGLVLSLWEGWCVFPAESQVLFAKSFENPTSLKKEEDRAQVEEADNKAAGRWKPVEARASSGANAEKSNGFKPIDAASTGGYDPSREGMDVDEDDGEAMDEDIEDQLMDDDIDGVPMSEDENLEGEPMDEDPTSPPPPDEAIVHQGVVGEGRLVSGGGIAPIASAPPSTGTRRRMRAVDMFADSDGSDDDK